MIKFVALLALFAPFVQAWGREGHEITAAIADSLVNPHTKAMLRQLLPQYDGATSPIAAWADDIKWTSGYAWSKRLHYINIKDGACTYSPSDCINNQCVAAAVANYTARLSDPSLRETHEEDLKFLVHYVGDIHQPLHVGYGSDSGGNNVVGTFMTLHHENLHTVWDTLVIERRVHDFFNRKQVGYSDFLADMAQHGSMKQRVDNWMQIRSSVTYWAQESARIVCHDVYIQPDGRKVRQGFNLQEDYLVKTYGIIDEQLIKGGARLAGLLDHIFEHHRATPVA